MMTDTPILDYYDKAHRAKQKELRAIEHRVSMHVLICINVKRYIEMMKARGQVERVLTKSGWVIIPPADDATPDDVKRSEELVASIITGQRR